MRESGERGDRGERVPLCPLCGQPIRDQKTAIGSPGSGAPAHFDCVLLEVAKGEALAPGEKVTYLGKGVFGIVSYRSGSTPFTIRKRIPYEEPAKPPGV